MLKMMMDLVIILMVDKILVMMKLKKNKMKLIMKISL